MKGVKQSFTNKKATIKKQSQKIKNSKKRAIGNKQIIDQLRSRFEVAVLLEAVKCPSCPFLATDKFLIDAHLHIDHELKSRPNSEDQGHLLDQDHLLELDRLHEQESQDHLDERDSQDGDCKQSRKRKQSADDDDEVSFNLSDNFSQTSATVLERERPDQLNWKFCFEVQAPEQRMLAIQRVKRHLFSEGKFEQPEVEQAEVEQAEFEQAEVEQAEVEQAEVEQAEVEQAKVEQAEFEQAEVEQAAKHGMHKCSVCDKSYVSKTSLKRHTTVAHKNYVRLKILAKKSTRSNTKSSLGKLERTSDESANNNKPNFQKINTKRSQNARKL